MHRYFLIPFIGFFLIISIIMIYLQFVNEDWKFLVPKIKLPDSCNNNNEVEFVIHKSDINQNRSFKDEKDVYNGNQFHPVLLLPCESCLLYTSPSPRDSFRSRMPSSA